VATCPGFEVKNVTVQHEDKEGFFFSLQKYTSLNVTCLRDHVFCFKMYLDDPESLFALLCMCMYTIQLSSYCEYFACKWGKFDLPAFFLVCNAQTTCDSIVWNNVISTIIN
jgi:hypothetical protein